jgi:hypothetical protein
MRAPRIFGRCATSDVALAARASHELARDPARGRETRLRNAPSRASERKVSPRVARASGSREVRAHAARARGSRALVASLLAHIACAALASAAQGPTERSCRVDYTIRARVEPAERALHGEETIVWRNLSGDDVFDLQLHLYWNAYANNRSTHMRESAGFARGSEVLEDEWGWQRVTSIEIADRELVSKIRYLQPDDSVVDDRTVFSVPLPASAKTGETVTVRLKWDAMIPRVRERTGCKGDFLFIAQWFPKVGVYDAGNGWNCHQFHSSTEFFSDYGTYDVTIELPARYEGKIGASGTSAEPERVIGERVIARFLAPSEADRRRTDAAGRTPLVHDFAWTADPRYVVHREFTFHFDEWLARHRTEVERVALALGRGVDELRERDVDVTLLLHPEHDSQAARHFDATCVSLFFYGLWFGGYPYEHITVVDPAWGAGGAGGMEYPTLFTAGSRMFTWPAMHSPESVTVHECGHQFWYGLVGNNEFEAAWLDEGFNTFTQNEALSLAYGPSRRTTEFSGLFFDGVALAKDPGGSALCDALALRRWSLPWDVVLRPARSSAFADWWRSQPALSFARMNEDPRWSARNGYLADPDSDPIDTPGWKYVDFQSYRQNSYRRPAVMLATLEGLVGRERFLRGMRLYSERWRYGHPYPQDFFDAFATGANADVAWYFEQAFRSTATVDWSVEVTQKHAARAKGWFQGLDGAFDRREPLAANPARASDAPPNEPVLKQLGDDVPKDDAPGEAAAKRDAPGDGEHKETARAIENSAGAQTSDEDQPWSIDVVVRRKGTFLLPLKLQLTYDDGSKETLLWSREEQARSTWWKPLAGREPSGAKLLSAVLDPERLYLVDMDMSNNQWFEQVDERAPWRWSERVLTQCAHLLHWYGGLGG